MTRVKWNHRNVRLQITGEIQLPLHIKWTFVVVTSLSSAAALGVDFIQGNHKNFWGINRMNKFLDNIQIPLLHEERRKYGPWGGNSWGLTDVSTMPMGK